MPASDNISKWQFAEQLPMFMDAVTLRDDYVTGLNDAKDKKYGMSGNMYIGDVWDDKLEASQNSGRPYGGKTLYESVADRGVIQPVTIYTPDPDEMIMGDGHRRVAAAADIQEKTGRTQWVPIIHDEDDVMSSHQFIGSYGKRSLEEE